MSDPNLDELAAGLSDFDVPDKSGGRPPREERVIAGFEEIQRFVELTGRAPQHGEAKDIFERLHAVRLDRLRELEECRALLAPLDHQGLLTGFVATKTEPAEAMDEDELLAELEGAAGPSEITELRHVRSRAEVRAAEEVANRRRCEDFDRFQPLFKQAESDLKAGTRRTRPFDENPNVSLGNFFILSGQMVYIAEIGEVFRTPNSEQDARLRAIYSNGTESNILMRSLQRALYKDEAGRRLTDPNLGPLFGDTLEEDDIESGTIYVLRSLSSHPFVAEHRELIHKIGVTGGTVETRIANAAHDATYLLADVEIVATYKLAGINRTKLEGLFHKIFSPAQLDLTIHDRFGHPVRPREWFLVPLPVIDETVKRIQDGSITKVTYDPKIARLVPQAE
ncbi:MAG: GIY-YIG nuclease family protein [Bacteroidetes bacterium]|nr:GIY-YIG nuclease family protein [Bacteroidota bacterium]